MTYTRHTTIAIEADGQMNRRQGELPAVIKRAPVAVIIIEGIDHRLAARLLRQLADEIEREDEGTP